MSPNESTAARRMARANSALDCSKANAGNPFSGPATTRAAPPRGCHQYDNPSSPTAWRRGSGFHGSAPPPTMRCSPPSLSSFSTTDSRSSGSRGMCCRTRAHSPMTRSLVIKQSFSSKTTPGRECRCRPITGPRGVALALNVILLLYRHAICEGTISGFSTCSPPILRRASPTMLRFASSCPTAERCWSWHPPHSSRV